MNNRLFLRKILNTKDFFFILAKHLDEIWIDYNWWFINADNDVSALAIGTIGWDKALNNTCKELNIEDCYKYYDSLDWMDSDELDADICTILEAMVFDENRERINYDS